MASQPNPGNRHDRPVIALNDHGLTLGVDADGAWVIWNEDDTVRLLGRATQVPAGPPHLAGGGPGRTPAGRPPPGQHVDLLLAATAQLLAEYAGQATCPLLTNVNN